LGTGRGTVVLSGDEEGASSPMVQYAEVARALPPSESVQR